MNRLNRYGIVIIATIALISVLGVYRYYSLKQNIIENWVFTDQQIEEYGPFWITVPAAENEGLPTDINGIQFEDDPSIIYLVLPKYVNTKKLVYYIRDGYESNYEARRVADFTNGDVEIAGKTLKLISTELPIMFVETDDENMPFYEFRYTYERDAICSGKAYFKDYLGEDGEKMYFKPRGNVTWAGTHKKPFTLVLENSESLLGMPSSKKWNLLSDLYDKTCLKNYTFYNLASNLEVQYQPEVAHIGLYINGTYEGIYLLTEKVSVDKKRVNIGSDDWLFIWGGSHPEQIIPYKSECWFGDTDNIHYPYIELLYPKNDSRDGLVEKQKYIQRYIDAVENENSSEYLDYLDVDSFVKFYWVQEAAMNYDSCYRSIFTCYKNDTGKLYYGPVWDMDETLGKAGFFKPGKDGKEIYFTEVEGWKTRELAYYRELFEHPEFREAAYNAYFDGGIREALWESVDIFKDEEGKIKHLCDIEYKMWDWEAPEWRYADTYEEHTQIVLDRYITRLKWIDEQMEVERQKRSK